MILRRLETVLWSACILGLMTLPAWWTLHDQGPARAVADHMMKVHRRADNLFVGLIVSVIFVVPLIVLALISHKKTRTRTRTRTRAASAVHEPERALDPDSWRPALQDLHCPLALTIVGVVMGLYLYVGAVAPELGRLTPSEAVDVRGDFWGEVVGYVDTRNAIERGLQTYYPLHESPDETGPLKAFVNTDFTTRPKVLEAAASHAAVPIRGLVMHGVSAETGAKFRALGCPPVENVREICPRSDREGLRIAAFVVPGGILLLSLFILWQDVRERVKKIRAGAA